MMTLPLLWNFFLLLWLIIDLERRPVLDDLRSSSRLFHPFFCIHTPHDYYYKNQLAKCVIPDCEHFVHKIIKPRG